MVTASELPRPQGGASKTLKQFYLLGCYLLMTMITDIFSDNLSRHLIADRSDEIAIFPKFTTPKMFLYFRMLSENHTRTDTLQHPNNFRNAVTRGKRQKYMHVIVSYFHRVYLETMGICYLLKYLLHVLSYVSTKYPLPILRRPYQMIFCVINRMRCSLESHALNITHITLPSAGKLFIPVHRTGYPSFRIS